MNNRVIKFRAWDKKEKVMREVVQLSIDFARSNVLQNDEWEIGTADPNIDLMQFTGLLDKNGKEIYEGDIIKGKEMGVCIVFWDKKRARFWITAGWGDLTDRCEVIGNIYENPELLKS